MSYTSSWNDRDQLMGYHDFLNFIRYLSVRKILNISLVQLSYFLSVLLKRPIVWGNPFFISLEPTALCNLACPQCPTGKNEVKRGELFLDLDTYKAIVEEMAGTTTILSLYNQGEPLMHDSFADMVKYATDRRIYTTTATNGNLLTAQLCRNLVEAGLDRIIISLDGTDQETYLKYRIGGDFEKVITGIRLLSEARQAKRKPFIIIQFLVFKYNLDQVPGIKKLGKRLGADRVRIKSAQIEYPESADEWIPSHKKYSRYRRNDRGEWMLAGKLRNRCRRLWQTAVITTDGILVPCCFDKLAKYPMGNMGKGTFRQFWKGREYNDFRKKVLGHRKEIEICTNCTEGIGRIFY